MARLPPPRPAPLSPPQPGLQDHYIGAIAALARRFINDPTVVGYEIMNEPSVRAVDGGHRRRRRG
jgi:hypothetical protein